MCAWQSNMFLITQGSARYTAGSYRIWPRRSVSACPLTRRFRLRPPLRPPPGRRSLRPRLRQSWQTKLHRPRPGLLDRQRIRWIEPKCQRLHLPFPTYFQRRRQHRYPSRRSSPARSLDHQRQRTANLGHLRMGRKDQLWSLASVAWRSRRRRSRDCQTPILVLAFTRRSALADRSSTSREMVPTAII